MVDAEALEIAYAACWPNDYTEKVLRKHYSFCISYRRGIMLSEIYLALPPLAKAFLSRVLSIAVCLF